MMYLGESQSVLRCVLPYGPLMQSPRYRSEAVHVGKSRELAPEEICILVSGRVAAHRQEATVRGDIVAVFDRPEQGGMEQE